jgi:hypothetical protein
MKVKFDRKGWPLTIPWPERGEWTTGQMCDGEGRCCVNGWLYMAFFGTPYFWDVNKYDLTPAQRAAGDAVSKRIIILAVARGYKNSIEFNNNPKTTDKDRADVWREAWEHFGYHEDGERTEAT